MSVSDEVRRRAEHVRNEAVFGRAFALTLPGRRCLDCLGLTAQSIAAAELVSASSSTIAISVAVFAFAFTIVEDGFGDFSGAAVFATLRDSQCSDARRIIDRSLRLHLQVWPAVPY
jgi:hypothetical protein